MQKHWSCGGRGSSGCLGAVVFLLAVSLAAPASAQQILVEVGDNWNLFKGTEEPSPDSVTGDPTLDWTTVGFPDTTWIQDVPSGFGYGDNDDATVLDDMRQIDDDPATPDVDESQPGYTTIYIRTQFPVASVGAITRLLLEVDYDDGFIAYINGVEVARRNAGDPLDPDEVILPYTETSDGGHDAGTPVVIDISSHIGDLENGTNVLALQGLNVNLTSSDLSLAPRLVANDFSLLLGVGEVVRFFRGTTAPSDPPEAWRAVGFSDASWETGPTGIGYGDNDDATVLSDMRQIDDDPATVDVDESQPGYASVFLRAEFEVPDPGAFPIRNAALQIHYDDGFIAYLNGTELARSSNMGNTGVEYAYDQTASGGHEANSNGPPAYFDIPLAMLQTGTNLLAIEGHNVALDSSDFSLIPEIVTNVCIAVEDVTCEVDSATGEVTVSWDTAGLEFDGFHVRVNGEAIPQSPVESDQTSVVLPTPLPVGDFTVEVASISEGEECSGVTCTVTCGDVDPGGLTCILSLVDDGAGGLQTQADLSWGVAPAGTVDIVVEREGQVVATLPAGATGHTDPDVEADEPEDDTEFEVIFNLNDGSTCTLHCGPISLCPQDLVCELVDDGGVEVIEVRWGNVVKEWESYTLMRDGAEVVGGIPGDATSVIDDTIVVTPGASYTYTLTYVAPIDEDVNCGDLSCTVTVPLEELAAYTAPPGGWDYVIDFSAATLDYNPVAGEAGNLDGSWIRAVDRDSWDGSAPLEVGAAPDGLAPGGIGFESLAGVGACDSDAGVLRMLDPGNTNNPGTSSLADQYPDAYDPPNNHALALGLDTQVNDRNLLRDGVTFAFRARLNPDSPAYMNAGAQGDGEPLDGGLGMVGMYFIDQADLLDDGIVGAPAGLGISLNSGGNLLMTTNPADTLGGMSTTTFMSFWVTVEDPEGDGSYNVTTYVNGDVVPYPLFGSLTASQLQAGAADFDPTLAGATLGNYLILSLPSEGNDGDVQIDYVAYKTGVFAPSVDPCAPCSNNRPTARIAASATTVTLSGGTASVTLNGSTSDDGDGGTQTMSYQWSKLSGPSGDVIASPASASTSVSFSVAGSYSYRLQVNDGETCNNSATTSVDITVNPDTGGDPKFVRGDSDSNGSLELTDGLKTLIALYQSGELPECMDAADADDNGIVELTDAVITFLYLFSSGTPPQPPTPTVAESYPASDCGTDPTPDDVTVGGELGCVEMSATCN